MTMTPDIVAKPAPIVLGSEVRRFEIPDLDRHAAWFMPRFLLSFPHLNERQAIGFLRGIVYSNEFHFLFQERGVALAQAMGSHALDGDPIIWERFVWVADPENKDQIEAAAFFYDNFGTWAKRKGIERIIVEQQSDVPHELVRSHLGRIYSVEQKIARIALN